MLIVHAFFKSFDVLFLKAFFAGLLISAPVGPVTVLVSRMTMQRHLFVALTLALGVSIADALMALLASFGVKVLGVWIPLDSQGFYIVVGVLLAGFSFYLWRTPPDQNRRAHCPSPLGGFLSGFSLTILNPLTLGGLITLFSILHIPFYEKQLWEHFFLISILFLGSCSWWFFLIGSIFVFTKNRKSKTLKMINTILACIVLCLGLYALVRGLSL